MQDNHTGSGNTGSKTNLDQIATELRSVGPFNRDVVLDVARRAYDSSHSGPTFNDLDLEKQNAVIGQAVTVLTGSGKTGGTAQLGDAPTGAIGNTPQDREFSKMILSELRQNPEWDEDRFIQGYQLIGTTPALRESTTQTDASSRR